MSTAQQLPADPKVVRKMEKDVANEAKEDEKNYQRALKELKSTEKSEAKAAKSASKAEKTLKKLEDKEHDLTKSLQKATYKHDEAVTSLHSAQGDLQVQKQQALRLKQNTETSRQKADQLFKTKQVREVERSNKLQKLHMPPPTAGANGSTNNQATA